MGRRDDSLVRVTTRENSEAPAEEKVSDQLEGWLTSDEPKTIRSLMDLFGEKSFAIVFVLLLAIPALPLPTAGATHVLEVIAMLLALELLVGRRQIWLPERFKRRELAGTGRQRFVNMLLRRIRWLERFSRPRLRHVLRQRLFGVVYGALVFALSLTAFLAPPFSGLDTLPALGVVVLSLGVLLEDFVVAVVGVVIGALGAVLVIGLSSLVIKLLKNL
jgi:hypothetical protein